MIRQKHVELPATVVPNQPGLVTTIEAKPLQQYWKGRTYFRERGGAFEVAGFGEQKSAKPSHITLSGDRDLTVDKFEKFKLNLNTNNQYVLTATNGSTLTLAEGIRFLYSKGNDGNIDLDPRYDSDGNKIDRIIKERTSTNLGAVGRRIGRYEDKVIYVGGAGNDYFDLSEYGAKDRHNSGGRKHPDKSIHIEGGGGHDTVYLDWTSLFTVTNNGQGQFEIRSSNGSVLTLKGVEQVHNSGEHDDVGCLSHVPVDKTVPLPSIMKNREKPLDQSCKR